LGVEGVFVVGESCVGDISCCSIDASLHRDLTFIDWTGLDIDDMSNKKQDTWHFKYDQKRIWIEDIFVIQINT
jgi:hypothetical protein